MSLRISGKIGLRSSTSLNFRNIALLTPDKLFAAGEQGVWYDPSDMSTLFQDSVGTTPVTAVEQPVGLVLDKSKGAGYSGGTFTGLGSELVTNGGFDSDTAWTKGSGWTISGGKLTFSTGSTNFNTASQSYAFTAGKTYRVTFSVTGHTAGLVRFWTALGRTVGPSPSSNGTYTFVFLATSSDTNIGFQNQLPGAAGYSIDDVSVRELPGNHATQSTSASRPVLSARVNLLTYTEQFDNAAWTSGNATITPNTTGTTDPLGGNTADIITIVPGQSAGTVFMSMTFTSGVQYKSSLYVKNIDTTSVSFIVATRMAGRINLSTGALSKEELNGWTIDSSSFTPVGNGWYFVTLTYTAGDSVTANYRAVQIAGSAGSSAYIWGADLRVANAGVNLPVYQRVVTATDYDTTGFPMYLRFDGTDDSMATGTINPGSVDKAQVFAGVRKLSADAPSGGTVSPNVVAELSASSTSNAGTFVIGAPWDAIDNRFFWRNGGTTRQQSVTTSTIYNSPFTGVLRCIGDISGDIASLTINGALAATNSSDQGTGNYGSYPLYIGSRAGTSLRFNGHLYGLIVRFSSTNLSAIEIDAIEKWVNSKTRAY